MTKPKNKTNYRAELEKGNPVVTTTVGVSMEPLLRTRRDVVIIKPVDRPLRAGDLPLFIRPNGDYVLHRIIRCDGEFVYTRGDNQLITEKVPKENVLGIAEEIIRKGKPIRCDSPAYMMYVKLWGFLFPLRYFCHGIKAIVRRWKRIWIKQ